MLGEWEINDSLGCILPTEVQSVFDKWEMVGVSYEPVLYLGRQVVKGINYMIICKSVTATLEPITGIANVVLNDFQGEITVVSLNKLI